VDWNDGLWVDSKDGKSEPQRQIKTNLENIAKIDIENLQFLLKMIKNMSFDVAGGNFINLNGSILRDGKIHYQNRRKKVEWEGAERKESMELLSEPQTSTPLELEEVFIQTDWGFVYCGIVDISQFMFIQGGLHWLWSDTGHMSRMSGWHKPQKPQFTKLVIGRAVNTEWYQSKRDFEVRAYGRGSYEDGEPTHNKSKYADLTETHYITSGLTPQDVVDMVELIPSFEDRIIKGKYGGKRAYDKAIEDMLTEYKGQLTQQGRSWQPSWLDRRISEFNTRAWREYEDSIIRFHQDTSIPSQIVANYGLLCDTSFVLRGGDITIQQCSANYPHRIHPLGGGHSHKSISAWAEERRNGWRTGKKPRIVSNWRKTMFDTSLTGITWYDEDDEETKQAPIYTIDDISNFNAIFYQYKMSQGILNRMVL